METLMKPVKNPVIYSDFPDIDIVRAGDTYYMVTTTMYFMPGGDILRSYDLINWEYCSRVYDVLEDTPRQRLEEGDAYILCTLDSNRMERYDVRISAINRDATGSKCFTVTVTDPDLLASSGGIVQGMSGSPIIQNGKLVGAVTHVLINDPTTGYGIFVENMLASMRTPLARVS